MTSEIQTPPSESRELLQRILKAVEPVKPRRGFEAMCAIVLALATTASAWCAYQSKLWGGTQAARANSSAKAAREATASTLEALQLRAFDASMLMVYMQAQFETNLAMEAFLAKRLRPDFKPAMEAWLKLDPLDNPSAPASPFQMKEYVQKESAEAERQQAVADAAMKGSRQARQFSDDYVLLTVLFASVLFFGGIARAFDSRRLRAVLAILAVLLFLGTLVALTTMPICRE